MTNPQPRVCAIIAEYNPFHLGHAYHIQEARRLSNCDILIAIMSGNYVQRGDLALLDKWTRAQEALRRGVDLVIELPSQLALQAGDYFALGGLRIAQAVGATSLAFGVEWGKAEDYWRVAASPEGPKRFDLSQRQAMSQAHPLAQTPNNQLGIAYAKACLKLGLQDKMTLIPIQRQGAGHQSLSLAQDQIFASGTAIRQGLASGRDIRAFVSDPMAKALTSDLALRHGAAQRTFFQLLKYQLTLQSQAQLQSYYEVKEGIEYVLKREIDGAQSLDQFLDRCSNKRFSKARLRRVCWAIVLQMTKAELEETWQSPIKEVRLLAASPQGIAYSKAVDLSFITQLKKKHLHHVQKQIDRDKLYAQLMGCGEQNFRRMLRNDDTQVSYQ